jgi:hypothetical protein
MVQISERRRHHIQIAHSQGLQTDVTLITWELWKERIGRIFNKASMPMAVVQKIKDESKNWILAGAKHLAEIIA